MYGGWERLTIDIPRNEEAPGRPAISSICEKCTGRINFSATAFWHRARIGVMIRTAYHGVWTCARVVEPQYADLGAGAVSST